MWRSVVRGREYINWKEGGKNKRQVYPRWLWEQHHGPIPAGYEIHHKDLDPLNNDITNLEAVTPAWHRDYHARLREHHRTVDGRVERECQRCHEWRPLDQYHPRKGGTYGGYCKPCTVAALREWRAANREHHLEYKRAWWRSRQQPPGPRQCAYCGGTFTERKRGSVYCSESCRKKAAYLRQK